MHRIAKGFFTGINYWGSKDAIHMWEHFDAAEIEKDFQVLRDCGITHLRVFPLWPVFQPLKALYGPQEVYEYGLGEDPLPDTPAGRAGVSEEACEKFEVFCALADKYNLKLIVSKSIFTTFVFILLPFHLMQNYNIILYYYGTIPNFRQYTCYVLKKNV